MLAQWISVKRVNELCLDFVILSHALLRTHQWPSHCCCSQAEILPLTNKLLCALALSDPYWFSLWIPVTQTVFRFPRGPGLSWFIILLQAVYFSLEFNLGLTKSDSSLVSQLKNCPPGNLPWLSSPAVWDPFRLSYSNFFHLAFIIAVNSPFLCDRLINLFPYHKKALTSPPQETPTL